MDIIDDANAARGRLRSPSVAHEISLLAGQPVVDAWLMPVEIHDPFHDRLRRSRQTCERGL
jgi:hypothetical protein